MVRHTRRVRKIIIIIALATYQWDGMVPYRLGSEKEECYGSAWLFMTDQ